MDEKDLRRAGEKPVAPVLPEAASIDGPVLPERIEPAQAEREHLWQYVNALFGPGMGAACHGGVFPHALFKRLFADETLCGALLWRELIVSAGNALKTPLILEIENVLVCAVNQAVQPDGLSKRQKGDDLFGPGAALLVERQALIACYEFCGLDHEIGVPAHKGLKSLIHSDGGLIPGDELLRKIEPQRAAQRLGQLGEFMAGGVFGAVPAHGFLF